MTETVIRDRIKSLRRVRGRDLVPHPKNWRTHGDDQRSGLSAVLETIGFAGALIARELPDKSLQLIDGHLRADMSPDQKVPVLILDVTEEEADTLLAVYDPIGAMAGTDTDALFSLVSELGDQSGDMAGLLGSIAEDYDIADMLAPEPLTDEDAVPEAPAEPVTQPGDIWVIGDHRLLCGDATSASDVERILDGATPMLCVTDPPYGVNYDPAWRVRAAEAGHLAYAAIRIGKVPNDDRSDWSEAWKLIPGDVFYCWSPAGTDSIEFWLAVRAGGFDVRNIIVWSKPHFTIGRGHYHHRHEPCIYSVRTGKGAHWIGDRKQTTVWESSLDKNVRGGHSTQKPVDLMERPLINHEGDVFDPFVGSGTTIIAAEKQSRRCYAIEISPAYCDISVKRWEEFTGKKAERQPK